MKALTRTVTKSLHYQQRCMLSAQQLTHKEQHAMDLESKYGAHNYHPVPAVISRGQGVYLWDVNDKQYFDFLSAYSAVNQGHCHPKIIATLKDQVDKLTLTSRAFYNDSLGEYCEFITKYFNYKRVLPMNTGVEACESTIKIARRWGYEIKNIKPNDAHIVFASNNFWGRSIGAVSASTDPDAYNNYGPFVPNFDVIEYNNIQQLQDIFQLKHDKIAAFMCEPIQGEAGVVIPDNDYLKQVRSLCDKYNILWIADEVQTGIGRCGKRLCVDWDFDMNDNVNNGPDIISMGKALSGGLIPVSAVITRTDEIMDVLTPGTHGSTYGGNPLACKVAITALDVLKEENMSENSDKMGQILLKGLKEFEKEFDFVVTTRGKGLFCAIEILNDQASNRNAWNFCLKLKDNGILAKPTHDNIIRLSPPLIITQQQIEQCLDVIHQTLKDF